MASPNSLFNELASSTFKKIRKDVRDNLSNRNALVKHIYKRGNYRKEDGGLSIACPIDYAANSTYQRYSDWDQLNLSQSDVLSSAEYQWRQISIHVVASGREKRINSGPTRIFNLVEAKIKNAVRSFHNGFSFDLYSDGSAANQINGIQALVSDTGLGTVGGIDSSLFPMWQNKVFDCSAQGVTASSTTIENNIMLPLWLQLDYGSEDQPDLIVMDNNYYTFFETSQTSLKRYAKEDSVSAGLVSIKYKTADVYYDGNSGIPANHMYMLNTHGLKLVVHKDADLEMTEPQTAPGRDGDFTAILWMGNLTLDNRSRQGVALD